MSAYATPVSIKKLFAIILALAVLFAPGVTGAAMAAAPNHNMAMMEAGHCQAPASNTGHHEQTDGKNCCISMCAAVAVTPSAPAQTPVPRQQTADFALPKTYQGLHTEIATPPPRHS